MTRTKANDGARGRDANPRSCAGYGEGPVLQLEEDMQAFGTATEGPGLEGATMGMNLKFILFY